MNMNEKAAYIKGLAEGLGVTNETKEGRIIGELIALVSDMADTISALEAECETLRDYIEELDEDLGTVEEDLYMTDGDECECDCDCDCDDCDCDCEDEEGYYEITCPSCGEDIYFDDSIETGDLVCPACSEKITEIECDEAAE